MLEAEAFLQGFDKGDPAIDNKPELFTIHQLRYQFCPSSKWDQRTMTGREIAVGDPLLVRDRKPLGRRGPGIPQSGGTGITRASKRRRRSSAETGRERPLSAYGNRMEISDEAKASVFFGRIWLVRSSHRHGQGQRGFTATVATDDRPILILSRLPHAASKARLSWCGSLVHHQGYAGHQSSTLCARDGAIGPIADRHRRRLKTDQGSVSKLIARVFAEVRAMT